MEALKEQVARMQQTIDALLGRVGVVERRVTHMETVLENLNSSISAWTSLLGRWDQTMGEMQKNSHLLTASQASVVEKVAQLAEQRSDDRKWREKDEHQSGEIAKALLAHGRTLELLLRERDLKIKQQEALLAIVRSVAQHKLLWLGLGVGSLALAGVAEQVMLLFR